MDILPQARLVLSLSKDRGGSVDASWVILRQAQDEAAGGDTKFILSLK
jgi:hypothetical protein